MTEKPETVAKSSRQLISAGVAYPVGCGLFLVFIGPWGLLNIGYLILASFAVPAVLVSAVLLYWLLKGAYEGSHVLLFIMWVCAVAFGVMMRFLGAWVGV
jgi:hypothetical protein